MKKMCICFKNSNTFGDALPNLNSLSFSPNSLQLSQCAWSQGMRAEDLARSIHAYFRLTPLFLESLVPTRLASDPLESCSPVLDWLLPEAWCWCVVVVVEDTIMVVICCARGKGCGCSGSGGEDGDEVSSGGEREWNGFEGGEGWWCAEDVWWRKSWSEKREEIGSPSSCTWGSQGSNFTGKLVITERADYCPFRCTRWFQIYFKT